jgi:hypothetical protein
MFAGDVAMRGWGNAPDVSENCWGDAPVTRDLERALRQ